MPLGKDTRHQPCAWTMDNHGTRWLHTADCLGRFVGEAQHPASPRTLLPPTYTWEDLAAVPRDIYAEVAAAARKLGGSGDHPRGDLARPSATATDAAPARVNGGAHGGYMAVARAQRAPGHEPHRP